ncbi:hypothetical protein ACFYNO_28340 [Kitasatospora sp. NPDC006697]|uniref:hypothetical protein n=1 Tax=Kitasatospora sp. NPDC006697 TaxID=3364020 RepID=UPI0036773AC6
MSWMGMWVVGALPDSAVRAVREQHGAQPWSGAAAEYREDLAWWAAQPPVALTRESAQPLAELMLCHVELAEAAEAEEACLQQLSGTPAEGVFVAGARKTHPPAALCHGLGPGATGLLPGRFGSFLLTADEVRSALPEVERALAVGGHRRAVVAERIEEWLERLGNGSQHQAGEFLDGPLRVLRYAERAGDGAVGCWRTY